MLRAANHPDTIAHPQITIPRTTSVRFFHVEHPPEPVANLSNRDQTASRRPDDVSLPRHGDPEPFLGVDEVVVVVDADVELHPVDLACESAGVGGVVGRDGGA